MNENKKKMYDLSGPKTVEAMKKRHFDAYYCSTAAEAVEKALELIPKTDSVSWGGVMTVDELGLKQRLAQEGYTLCSGDAMGADRTAQEACLQNGGSALVFPATELVYCPVREHVLYAAEGGFELGFSAQRALSRNRLIHAMGEKTLVAQTSCGKGGTWSGSLDNLQHEYSPLFVFDDGSDGAAALCTRGATPVRSLDSLQSLTPAQMQFHME